jgi:DNA repair ATPase RecN
MKRFVIIIVFALSFQLIKPQKIQAQEQETQQLLLNIEKLAELTKILNSLYKGYKILYGGYTKIKGIAEGNYKLHQVFLDGLWEINPSIKKYKRITDIVSMQIRIVNEYKDAYKRFRQDKNFTLEEIKYLSAVYKNLLDASVKNLDELFTIMTAKKLRMSDDERINGIDRVFNDMREKLGFLRQFNSQTKLLALQRQRERIDVETIQQLYNLK